MINKDGTVVVGVKGKSGRKSRRQETAKIEALQKAWEKVLKEMNKKDVERVALPLALKDMVEKKDVKGSFQVEQITGMTIEMDTVEAIEGTIEDDKYLEENPKLAKLNLDESSIQNENTEAVRGSEVLDK